MQRAQPIRKLNVLPTQILIIFIKKLNSKNEKVLKGWVIGAC